MENSALTTKQLIEETQQGLWHDCIEQLAVLQSNINLIRPFMQIARDMAYPSLVLKNLELHTLKSHELTMGMLNIFKIRRSLRSRDDSPAQIAIMEMQEQRILKNHDTQIILADTFRAVANPVTQDCFNYHAARAGLMTHRDMHLILQERWRTFYRLNPEDNDTAEARGISLAAALGEVYDLFVETADEIVLCAVEKRAFSDAQKEEFTRRYSEIMGAPEAFAADIKKGPDEAFDRVLH